MHQHSLLPSTFVRPLSKILVSSDVGETRVVVLENEQICEIHIERFYGKSLVGNIFLGKVIRVLPGLQSAFIDIGLDKAAFLHVLDLVDQPLDLKDKKKIEQIIFEGQKILVQVIKDPIGNKGARLTTQITFPGRYLVFLPQDKHIGISQRITNIDEREKIKKRLESLLPENHLGYIVRTNASEATDEELKKDILYLNTLWNNLQKLVKNSPAGSLLQKEIPVHIRILRDIVDDSIDVIMVDSEKIYNEMVNFTRNYIDNLSYKIKFILTMDYFFEQYKIEEEIKEALNPRVNLKFGGYLIIETTEAMTTIDVNTGGFVGNYDFDETILKTNIDACYSIARELRLRNIGGIIIIDFIDMANDYYKQIVLTELTKALELDRTKVTVNGFTNLGLVELTRKRTRESLKNILTQSCKYCKGQGFILTAKTVTYDIIRTLVNSSKTYPVLNGYRIVASTDVIEVFLGEESDTIKKLSHKIGKPIYLIEDSAYYRTDFDVVII